ncbi:hypothetical protein BFL36_05480 [Clavibacter michiganensis]|uniref:Uncharacterized protein n=1 Tax=Clavibacter michiganensis TaxID=28447 RepID=A0A251YLL6_9MICO|nr:hypothetical protein BFL36_05480 [Clavibacter michiganensis]
MPVAVGAPRGVPVIDAASHADPSCTWALLRAATLTATGTSATSDGSRTSTAVASAATCRVMPPTVTTYCVTGLEEDGTAAGCHDTRRPSASGWVVRPAGAAGSTSDQRPEIDVGSDAPTPLTARTSTCTADDGPLPVVGTVHVVEGQVAVAVTVPPRRTRTW